MKRFAPFLIIIGVLLLAIASGGYFLHTRSQRPQPGKYAEGTPGAEPWHLRGKVDARVAIEEFGDFECLPCFMLWPVMKNLEKDYGAQLSMTFREHPLPQHRNAMAAAKAAEAAGLQGHFWEMHDSLYLNRAVWIPALDPRPFFSVYATYLHLDVDRFRRDMDSAEVAKRLAADQGRGASLKIDRTPVLYVDGELLTFSDSPEDDLHKMIDAALHKRPNL